MSLTAMAMEVVSESSNHVVTPLAPNVCITPAAPSPLPLPYPLMGTSAKLDPGTENTKTKGKKILNADCKIKTVNGNEPGTQKDIVTFTTAGHAFPMPVLATVQFEGSPVSITGNPGFANTM
jgi:hypothetical protein